MCLGKGQRRHLEDVTEAEGRLVRVFTCLCSREEGAEGMCAWHTY